MSFISEIINNTSDESVINNVYIYETCEKQPIVEEIRKCQNCNDAMDSTLISIGKCCSYICYDQFTESKYLEYLEYLEYAEALDELDRRWTNYEDYDYCESVDELINCKKCNKLSPHNYCCNECENEDYNDEEDKKYSSIKEEYYNNNVIN